MTREVIISNVNRDDNGNIVLLGGTTDPSTKKVEIRVSWPNPFPLSQSSTFILTHTLNYSQSHTSVADFNAGTLTKTAVVTGTPGEGQVILGNNNKAKWCSPEFSSAIIDLKDADVPVAVAATAAASTATPNDVLIATASNSASSVKLAYVKVTANSDVPFPAMEGIFTLDEDKYSPGTFPTGIGLDNNFKTNSVKYYKSKGGKKYALITTDLPDKEVIAVLVDDGDPGSNSEFQDTVGVAPNFQKIYKYQTFFNTRIYNGSPLATQDLNTGWLSPTTDEPLLNPNNGDGNGFDTDPFDDAYHDDNDYAIDANSGSDNGTSTPYNGKDKHLFYNYNVSIPTDATITGIAVRLINRVSDTGCATTRRMYASLSWNGGAAGTWTSDRYYDTLSSSMATDNIGGQNDTWGHSWTIDQLNNNNLRLRLTNVANSQTCEFRLDWAALQVYYKIVDPGYDHSPYGHGGTALTILEETNMGYVASGGYLYAFDLNNIDSKSTSSGLDMVGCRIQLDASDCNSGKYRKYGNGDTGTAWDNENIHYVDGSPSCVNGGNTENYATNDIDAVKIGTNTYIFAAVGFWTNPELNIVNTTSVPTGSTTPSISSTSCGTFSGNSGWKKVGDLDFNDINDGGISEEASNSVFVRSDGKRAYMSSNGGIDADGNGIPDSKQFYIINTEDKTLPKFLNGTRTGEPTKGYYYGGTISIPPNTFHNDDLYPRRSLTVLNGERAILVGQDLGTNGDTQEYQVLDIHDENAVKDDDAYCNGIDFDAGINDLTSISEADHDNFVYLVTNTKEFQMRIIQGGADSAFYIEEGQFDSNTIDATQSSVFNRFISNVDKPDDSTLKMQIAVASASAGVCPNLSSAYYFIGPDKTNTSFYTPIGNTISAQVPFGTYGTSPLFVNPGRCFRYKAWLTSNHNQQATPVIKDFFLNYSQ